MIVTKDNKVYKFDYRTCEKVGNGDYNSKIESALFGELCGENIVDFANGSYHVVARTEGGRLFN
jgi:alpha-tubulin suppressor-like RCC1 family protein